MGESRRIQRAEKEFKQIIANFLLSGIPEDLPGLVTVSMVKAARDLKSAQVFISVLGSDDERDEALDIIQGFAPEIQQELNHKLHMKFCPKLKFHIDRSTDEIIRIEKILYDIKQGTGSES